MNERPNSHTKVAVGLAVVAIAAVCLWQGVVRQGANPADDAATKQASTPIAPPASVDEARRLLQAAISSRGGTERLNRYLEATYQRIYDLEGRSLPGTLLHDGGKTTVRIGVEPMVQVGRSEQTCWLRRRDVVTVCALEDRALLRINQAMHDAAILTPLLRPPYRVLGGTLANEQQRRHRIELAISATPWRLVVSLEQGSGHIEHLGLRHAEGLLDAIDADLNQYKRFDTVAFPSERVLHFEELEVSDANGRTAPAIERERIVDVQPGVDRRRMAPPAMTTTTGIRLSKRPSLLVALATAPGGHGDVLDAFARAEKLLPAELPFVEPEWYEVLGHGTEPDGVSPRVQVWVASEVYVVGTERTPVGRKLTRITTEGRLASQVVRVPFADIPARYARFAREVTEAGLVPIVGPRVVRVVAIASSSGQNADKSPWLVELQLPVAATASDTRPVPP